MLQFQTKSIDICRISKLLVKYNIKSSITDSVITLEGDIPDDLLSKLCDSININGIQNFIGQEPLSALSETSFSQNEKFTQAEVVEMPKDIATVCVEEKQTVGTSDDTTTNKVEQSENPTKKYNGEDTLQEVIGFAFDKLDPSKKVVDQVESFLADIGMGSNEKMIPQSFVIACDIKKIKYENVILRLHEEFPEMSEDAIKNTLKKTFKDWLEKYPTLAEKCPKISMMAILKLFAKKFA